MNIYKREPSEENKKKRKKEINVKFEYIATKDKNVVIFKKSLPKETFEYLK